MVDCEGCGAPLAESVDRCSRCAQPTSEAAAPGHLSRVVIAGDPGATHYGTATATGSEHPALTPPSQFSSTPIATSRAAHSSTASADADHLDHPTSPSTPSGPEWDPDATTRFMPSYASRNDIKNNAALVALAVALVAAVSSLAWLIGQSVSAAPPLIRPPASASASATPISTVAPKGATVCSPELARSTNTTCTLGRRVLTGVRTLGTDLPDTFRVTVTDPQSNKNATFVCSIKSWIQCVTSGDVTIYVQRQV